MIDPCKLAEKETSNGSRSDECRNAAKPGTKSRHRPLSGRNIRRSRCDRCSFEPGGPDQGGRAGHRGTGLGAIAGGQEFRRHLGRIERPGARRLRQGLVRRDRGARRPARSRPSICRRRITGLLRRLRQFRPVAGAAFARRSDPGDRSRTTAPIARSTPSWRGRCCGSTAPDATYWIQDYHFLTLGAELRRLGIKRPHRLLPAYAVAGPRT